MRKSSPIDPLISKTMQGLLAATVLQPDRSWYLSDLSKRLNVRPSTLQGSLAALVKAGVLTRRRDGNRVYYRADPDCPFLRDLQGLIGKTAGLVDVLREVMARLKKRVVVAFLHGSVAKSAEKSASDVDLIVIGSLGLADMTPLLERAEIAIGPVGQCQRLHAGRVCQEACSQEPFPHLHSRRRESIHSRWLSQPGANCWNRIAPRRIEPANRRSTTCAVRLAAICTMRISTPYRRIIASDWLTKPRCCWPKWRLPAPATALKAKGPIRRLLPHSLWFWGHPFNQWYPTSIVADANETKSATTRPMWSRIPKSKKF